MKLFTNITGLITILSILFFSVNSYGNTIETIEDLNTIKNETVKSLRNDVRKSIYIIKSRMPAKEIPELKFYRYAVKKGDTLWSIMSATSLDMDSLISVNSLSTSRDITPGKVLYIPNMRGIILEKSSKVNLEEYLAAARIDPGYVKKVNRAGDLDKDHLYIPCGRLTDLERSLFIGTGFMSPLETGRRTSGFGMRRNPYNNREYEFHSGVDISCPVNTKIYASRDGKVTFSGYMEGYGNLVILSHEYGYQSYYGHLKTNMVKAGDNVARGKLIALSGNTGRTTGPHLHFEVRRQGKPVNPGMLLRFASVK